ncbi:hypothetical protein F9Y90_04500 (plasmid) [Borrelia miyamotoi]|uniref:Lipoprotein n=1 Tax=Borrelia miyamotoi TaxID=47466 RepID=A0AAX3JPE6_9SPIR|nr:hypothetical protein [Borrelia miyamotoi]QFP42374.1 hypothetical protein F9Y90_04500 [Borrelia miyamotoi]QFP48495.1 hypothetical protein F9Y91_04485 [Borrelia miyamotoi]WAZ72396.1 hypothetical protein O5404_05080 [Borrelia miyamotoi]
MKILGVVFCLLYALGMNSCKTWTSRDSSKMEEAQRNVTSSQLDDIRSLDHMGVNYAEVYKVGLTKSLDTDDSDLRQLEVPVEEERVVPEIQLDFQLKSVTQLGVDDDNKDNNDGREGNNTVDGKKIGKNKQYVKDNGNLVDEENKSQDDDNLDFSGTKNPNYTELIKEIKAYKENLSKKLTQFNLENLAFKIPFNKISSEFASKDKQEEIYTVLGCDVELIEKLGDVFSRLNLAGSKSFNDSLRVSRDILSVLSSVSRYFQGSLSYFNDEFLDKISNYKSKDDIDQVLGVIVKIGQVRDGLIKSIDDCVKSLESVTEEKRIVTVLKESFAQNGDIKRKVSTLKEFNDVIESLVDRLKVK